MTLQNTTQQSESINFKFRNLKLYHLGVLKCKKKKKKQVDLYSWVSDSLPGRKKGD